MIRFECDYTDGCAPEVLEALIKTNGLNTIGYGNDEFCKKAKETIKAVCASPNAEVHFAVGGTQANTIIISSILRPYEGVVCCESGHINVHETGAIEATGHKVLAIPAVDGKVTADKLKAYLEIPSDEHVVKPGMVYISFTTETGSLYTAEELESIYEICKSHSVPLFIDGARMAYGLAASKDIDLPFIASHCDVFYIGGTKCGAMFGEAMVFTDPSLAKNIRYMIKRHGALLAKGRLLGVQFDTLFTDGLYFSISAHAIKMADKLRAALKSKGYTIFIETVTNQIFVVLENARLEELKAHVSFGFWERPDKDHTVVRIATSWATLESDIDAVISIL